MLFFNRTLLSHPVLGLVQVMHQSVQWRGSWLEESSVICWWNKDCIQRTSREGGMWRQSPALFMMAQVSLFWVWSVSFCLPGFRMVALLDQTSLKIWVLHVISPGLGKKPKIGNCYYPFFSCPWLLWRAGELQDTESETSCCTGTGCY